jgi:hypothetical protein
MPSFQKKDKRNSFVFEMAKSANSRSTFGRAAVFFTLAGAGPVVEGVKAAKSAAPSAIARRARKRRKMRNHVYTPIVHWFIIIVEG